MKHYSAATIERAVSAAQLLTCEQLMARLRSRLDGTAAGKARMARELGLSMANLSRLLRGNMTLSPAIAERLGFKPVTRFERIGP